MRSWKNYVAALLFNVAVSLAVLLLKGFNLKIYYADALGVGGAVSILLGLLAWVTSAGAFDTIGYALSILLSKRRDKDLYEYITRKKESRRRRGKGYAAFLIVGAVFLTVSFLIPIG